MKNVPFKLIDSSLSRLSSVISRRSCLTSGAQPALFIRMSNPPVFSAVSNISARHSAFEISAAT